MRVCQIRTLQCCAQGDLRCFACKRWTCGNCSGRQLWASYRIKGGWAEREHRICNDCWVKGWPGESSR